jgi:hypothetical protein
MTGDGAGAPSPRQPAAQEEKKTASQRPRGGEVYAETLGVSFTHETCHMGRVAFWAVACC